MIEKIRKESKWKWWGFERCNVTTDGFVKPPIPGRVYAETSMTTPLNGVPRHIIDHMKQISSKFSQIR